MAELEVDLKPILGALVDQVGASGYFTRVNTHEPKSAPVGRGFTAAIWVQHIKPVLSGLAATTVRVEWRLRIFTNMLAEPQDAIDPQLMDATCYLIGVYSLGFTLGGRVRSVDLLGATGNPLSAQAGYGPVDNKMFRIMDITLPVIINDAFTQGA